MCIRDRCELITNERVRPLVYEDNRATISHVEKGQAKSLRHLVGLKEKYVMNEFSKGTFDLKWVPSTSQLADPFTKANPRATVEKFRKLIMQDR